MTKCKYQSIYSNMSFALELVQKKVKNVGKLIFNEFIHGGHLIALGTAGIAFSSMYLFNVIIRWEFLLIAYLGTLCIYSYDYHRELDTNSSNNSRKEHLKKYSKYSYLLLTLYGIGFLSLLIYFGNLESILFGISLLSIGLLYTRKFKELTGRLVGFKSYYTAFSFSLLIIFTALYCSYPIGLSLAVFFVFVFLQILIVTSFCDIKDIESDKKQNLLTLPIYLGKYKFQIFLHVLNFVSLFIIVTAVYNRLLPTFSIFLILSNAYCFFFIQKIKNQDINIQTFTNIIVDAEYFFWPFFLILGKMFLTVI